MPPTPPRPRDQVGHVGPQLGHDRAQVVQRLRQAPQHGHPRVGDSGHARRSARAGPRPRAGGPPAPRCARASPAGAARASGRTHRARRGGPRRWPGWASRSRVRDVQRVVFACRSAGGRLGQHVGERRCAGARSRRWRLPWRRCPARAPSGARPGSLTMSEVPDRSSFTAAWSRTASRSVIEDWVEGRVQLLDRPHRVPAAVLERLGRPLDDRLEGVQSARVEGGEERVHLDRALGVLLADHAAVLDRRQVVRTGGERDVARSDAGQAGYADHRERVLVQRRVGVVDLELTISARPSSASPTLSPGRSAARRSGPDCRGRAGPRSRSTP